MRLICLVLVREIRWLDIHSQFEAVRRCQDVPRSDERPAAEVLVLVALSQRDDEGEFAGLGVLAADDGRGVPSVLQVE